MSQPTTPNRAAQIQNQVATRGGGEVTADAYEVQLKQWFAQNSKRMASLAGSQSEANNIFVSAVNIVTRTPKLMNADFMSLASCFIASAETKLYPGYRQECAYVPLNNRKSGKLEANFWPMYQGLVKHVWNTGIITSIAADVVYDGDDEFDYRKGTDNYLIHKPKLASPDERGKRIAAYCVMKTKYGETIFEIVPIDFCEKIKNRSPGGKASDSPWNTSDESYNVMCKKTAFKQAIKWVPKSTELAVAISYDDAAETDGESDRGKTKGNIIDLSGFSQSVTAATAAEAQEQQAVKAQTVSEPAAETSSKSAHELPPKQ